MYLNSTSETNISGMNASVVNLEQVQGKISMDLFYIRYVLYL